MVLLLQQGMGMEQGTCCEERECVAFGAGLGRKQDEWL